MARDSRARAPRPLQMITTRHWASYYQQELLSAMLMLNQEQTAPPGKDHMASDTLRAARDGRPLVCNPRPKTEAR